jgi:choline-glycine betaine transporter
MEDGKSKKGLSTGTCREVKIGPFVFNPVVTVVGFAVLWALAIYCMVQQEVAKQRLVGYRDWVSNVFTWLYIGTQNVWIVFAFWLSYQYGHIKFCKRGEEDAKPEFTDAEYFMMTFSAGVAVGLFFYGAAEPIWLYYGYSTTADGNRYTDAGQDNTSQFEDAQWAMTQTVFHWGFHGWIPYQVVGATVGLVHYRMGLPMTIRSCFYPIMGKGIYGWFGDAVDALSIATIVGGVCTSLGLGTSAIASGINRLQTSWDIRLFDRTDEDEMKIVNSVIIALITLVATASVVSGVNYGIKFLSILAFNAGMFLLLAVFFLDNTWFFLNLMTQTLGHYFQNIIQLSFFTDAFAEIGRDNNGAQGSELSEAPDGFYPWETSLMAPWTIFYWGWWVSWAPFVGTFLARISKGRTIRQLVVYSLVAPLLYCIIWFSVFGGAAIKDQWTFDNVEKIMTVTTPAPALMTAELQLQVDAQSAAAVYEKVVDETTGLDCYRVGGVGLGQSKVSSWDKDAKAWVYAPKDEGGLGLGPVNAGGLGLACNLGGSSTEDEMFFLLLQSYEPYGNFLCLVSIFCLTVYFITSSDSGSLIVDTIAANGRTEAHPFQRILWSFTEGAVAIGLMVAGGSDSTGALQAISVVMGLPYTIVLCFMCVSLNIACAQEDKILKGDPAGLKPPADPASQPCRSGFKLPLYRGIFDLFELVCSLDTEYLNTFVASIVPFLKDLILPFITVATCFSKLGRGQMSMFNILNTLLAVVSVIVVVSCRVLHHLRDDNLAAFQWTFYVALACVVSQVRTQVRQEYNIDGNIVEDFLASLFLYPMVLNQCAKEVEESPPKKDDDEQFKLTVEDKAEAAQ